MDHVVDFAPTGWDGTSWESASAVSNEYRAADRDRYRVAGPADVQWLTPGTQHHRDHPGVTRDPAG
ncbi:MAG: hypothetical protein M3Y48_24540, partial [Actinomycetota bacterium]|nr:hypothetical protein [Actinomycetota bacterium]